MRSTKVLLLLSFFVGFFQYGYSQPYRGNEGDVTISTTNNIVNTYADVTADAGPGIAGGLSITVDDATMTGGAFGGAVLAGGDLIMIIQMQGARMNNDTQFSPTYSVPNGFTWTNDWKDHIEAWGSPNDPNPAWAGYDNSGRYEQIEVLSVVGNTINLQCALQNDYTASGHVQVVRVPRYRNLTVNGGSEAIVPELWDGEIGGVVAIEVLEILDINAGSTISASRAGFRGGQVDNTGQSGSTGNLTGVTYLGSDNENEGSEKGEGIFGFTAEYDAIWASYGIAAACNGGGGAGYQNAGGGGGSNVYQYTGSEYYTGNGVPDPTYNAAWALDFSHPPNPNPSLGGPNLVVFGSLNGTFSPGGGRGGYTLADYDPNEFPWSPPAPNPLVVGPRNASWEGDARKTNGGRGGHPLTYDPARIFFGGGGGAGDQDQDQGGSGGRGGGLVYITNYGSITGSGGIEANGEDGESSGPLQGNDGAGGGGAGGWIHIENAAAIPASVQLSAIGGDGGDMSHQTLGTVKDEASGPGGSGTGGAIAFTSGTPTQNVSAGANGVVTTDHPTQMMANFPPNGATNGSDGVAGLSAPYYDLVATDAIICGGVTANVSVALLGNLPAGGTITWYDQAIGGSVVNTGLTYTTPVLLTTTTYWVGVCANGGQFRIPVTVTVNLLDDASFSYSAASYCSTDPDPTPTITGLAGGNFTSAPAGLVINGTTGVIDVSASTPGAYTITYTTTGPCPNSSDVAVTITTLDDASFSYSAASYCISEPDPTPTITGVGGGAFTSAPAGLSINGTTGAIDVSASTPGVYTITYTTSGSCSNSSDVVVTITTLDDASFSYSAASYCSTDPDPTPTITGVGGGAFTSAPAGLSINGTTGVIDVSASTPGAYTITYTTAGSCSNSSNVALTISNLDDASFNYSAASYCVNDADPTPTITGVAGGAFTSVPAGLSINGTTGAIDVSASTPGAYTITYTTVGSCANSSNQAVTINALDDASFSYSAAAYCVNDVDPTPTITGLAGGGFTSAPAGLSINGTTGAIDLSLSTPGAYTITYTTTGACPSSSNVAVTINALDDASFSYSAATYCSGDADPVPTITGLAGGGFTSAPGGLSINGSTGIIDVSASTPGAYTITYTTTGACPNSSDVAVTINALQDASFTMTATCAGGIPTITGTAGGSFAFNPAPAPGDLAMINAGTGVVTNGTLGNTYFVEYTTPGPCPASLVVSVVAATDLAYVPTVTDENCGAGDGVIDLVASGGDGGPYQYSITGGAPYSLSGNFTGLSAATYNISILDNSGCEITGTESVSSTGGPSIDNVAITDPTCAGGCDGAITITVSGGTAPYSYQWFDAGMSPIGLDSPTLSGQCAGTYSVEVTDAAGGGGVFFLEDFGLDAACANQNQLATTAIPVNGAWTQTVLAAEGGVPNQWFISSTEAGMGAGNCGDGCLGNPALTNQSLHVGSLGVGLCPSGDCGAAYNAGGTGETHKRIESPVIDCSGQSGITLSFNYMHFGELGIDQGSVQYFDGTTWSSFGVMPQGGCCGGPCGSLLAQGQWSPVPYSMVLPASADNNPNVRIGFVWDNDGNNSGADPSFAVDDIELSTSAAVGCPAIANATLTDPAAPTISGNTPVCVNGTMTLTGSGTPDPTTPWTSLPTSVATIDNTGLVTGVSAGTATITYTDNNGCQQTEVVTVNALDDATFGYSAASYCLSDPDPAPTITGLAGGTFSSAPAGLSINASTGVIDVSASTVGGPYTVTYTTSGPCPNSATFDVTITALDDASFSYASVTYCQSDADPTPTITGELGGAFSGPAGLVINTSTGVIDLSASTVGGPYTVTYTTTVPCANSSTFDVTITALDDASFGYASATYCQTDADPTPTITGEPGGTFSGPAGLSINATTGAIDVSTSTVGGPYTVTYTTTAPCANSSTFDVTITAQDDAGFSYASAIYCQTDADPTPAISGELGGTFSGPAGLSINAGTGVIDVSASTVGGPYTVTYTTTAPCANSSTFDVTITAQDDAGFSYASASYCQTDADPTPTITGELGGTFSGPAGLSINAGTGVIDVSASTVGGPYTVTYTTTAPCANSSTFDVIITALDDANFSYASATYCQTDADPTPTVTGELGGAFSGPAGLSINAGTGVIDVSASTVGGPYTVTYTTTAPCANSSTFDVSITALDDASFSYASVTYCQSDADPTPTITGELGGAFSGPAGLSINAGTGVIDISASTVGGPYTVTYTTTAPCANSSTFDVTITAQDDAGFSYASASYCQTDADPTPTITGELGGTFSGPAGLSINAGTGVIDVSASTVGGPYTVTYTTSAPCANSSTFDVTINGLDDASFSYSALSYCIGDLDQSPTITGVAGGSFTSVPAGLSINSVTGVINVNASTAGSYTVTYTTAGTCSNSSDVTVAIGAQDDATFNYTAALYCEDGTDPIPTISGLSGGAFTSSPAGLTINAVTGVIDASASTAGAYTVTYTTNGACPNSSDVSVTIAATPTLTITDPAGVCSPSMVDLTLGTVTAGSSAGTISYWTDPAASVVLGTPNSVTTGTYYIQLVDGNSCSSIEAVNAVVNAQPNVTVTNSGPICSGTSLILNETAGDATSWSWSTLGGALITTNTDQSPTVSGAVDGDTFTVTVMDGSGCTNTANTTISVIPQPAIDPVVDVTACGSYVLPAITGINLTGSEAYYDGPQSSSPGQITNTTITGSQVIWIFDGNGSCSSETSYNVTINPLPTIDGLTGSGSYCEGDPVADILVSMVGSGNWTINYTLDGVPQTVTGSTSPLSLGNAAGVYTLVDISDGNCSNTLQGTQTIVVHQYPAEPISGSDETYCTTDFFNEIWASGIGGTFTWYSDPGLTDTIGSGSTLLPSNTEGTLIYYVTETANGCEGPASEVSITVENCEVIIPTAFTPDGDGVNDGWEILYLDENYPDNMVRVYNRWGSLIYEHEAGVSNPYSSNMWDGTYLGQPLPVGSYYFIIDFNDDGVEPEKGTVSIILNK